MKRLFALLWLTLCLPPAALRGEQPVTVFAAASLGGVLEEIAQGYDGAVVFSYGGSGAMARQVAAGAPADLVILANMDWMTWLADQGIETSPQIIAQNTLTVIAPHGNAKPLNPNDIPAALGDNRLAMGQRDAVPAGVYTRQWLTKAGLWADLSDQLAEADNVRAALALVARADVPLGVVYASDALTEPAVTAVYTVPRDLHDPIVYPAAVLREEGQAFLTHLTSPKVATILTAHGFGLPPR